MNRSGGVAVLGLAFVLATTPIWAQGKKDDKENPRDLNNLIKLFSDDHAPPPEREQALRDAMGLATNQLKPERVAPFKEALGPLVSSLVGKRQDPQYWKLIALGFEAMNRFAPWPDLGPLVKPYLKDGTLNLRMVAARAIDRHGAQGVTPELLAILEEKVDLEIERETELLQNAIVGCARRLPASEQIAVDLRAVKKTFSKGVKLFAIQDLGDMAALRKPTDYDQKAVQAALFEIASTPNQEPEVAANAALALVRHGSWDGIGECVKRLDQKRGARREIYRAICEASGNTKGFLNVPVERFGSIDRETKANVIKAMKDWWEQNKGRGPDSALFDLLKTAGVNVPADLTKKEVIVALIDGMDLDDRTLRYKALDAFVKKTGRSDFGAKFKILNTSQIVGAGSELTIAETEPEEGFQDGKRAGMMRAQQKEKVKEIRAWWDKNSGNASYQNGMWIVPDDKGK